MPKEMTVRLRLTVDDDGWTATIRGADRSTERFLRRLGAGERQARRYGRAGRDAAAANRELGRSFLDAHGRHLRYGGAAGLVYGAQRAAAAVLREADAWASLSNRLRTVAESDRHLADLRERVYDVSRRTRSDFGATSAFYARLAASADHLNLREQDLLRVTETLNRQVQLGGSSAEEAGAGLIQLGQGLASGRLAGDQPSPGCCANRPFSVSRSSATMVSKALSWCRASLPTATFGTPR